MSNELFETALGVETPWYVKDVNFDAGKRLLTIAIDFKKGSRFPCEGMEGLHPVHDTQAKRYRHLNFFQHECYLEVRAPRIKLPDGRVVLIEPGWAGKLSGFTLLFEALVLTMCRQMPFAAVARMVGEVLASGAGDLPALRRTCPGARRSFERHHARHGRDLQPARPQLSDLCRRC